MNLFWLMSANQGYGALRSEVMARKLWIQTTARDTKAQQNFLPIISTFRHLPHQCPLPINEERRIPNARVWCATQWKRSVCPGTVIRILASNPGFDKWVRISKKERNPAQNITFRIKRRHTGFELKDYFEMAGSMTVLQSHLDFQFTTRLISIFKSFIG